MPHNGTFYQCVALLETHPDLCPARVLTLENCASLGFLKNDACAQVAVVAARSAAAAARRLDLLEAKRSEGMRRSLVQQQLLAKVCGIVCGLRVLSQCVCLKTLIRNVEGCCDMGSSYEGIRARTTDKTFIHALIFAHPQTV